MTTNKDKDKPAKAQKPRIVRRRHPNRRQLTDPSLFLNRELSLLEFHKRVLEQAKDAETPLLERLRFLTISSAILDEFFEIRVGGLKEQVVLGVTQGGADGLTPQETLSRIRPAVLGLVAEQYRVLNGILIPALEKQGVVIHKRDAWTPKQKRWVKGYFTRQVLPVLTPVGLDPAHPFPRILNKSLNFIVTLEGKDAFGRSSRDAVVQAPRVLPRLIELPRAIAGAERGFVLLSAIIHAHVAELFPGMRVTTCDAFRVTRNSDLWIDEEEVEDLLLAVQGELPGRQYASAVRLEIADTCSDKIAETLQHQFNLGPDDLYRVRGPVNVHRLQALYDVIDRPDLKFATFNSRVSKRLKAAATIFDALRERDLLLHHPFDSFSPVVELLTQAAADPQVLAIKQTVYRTEQGSPITLALIAAARAGKEVTVVVELRARFDEARNIELASTLQEAGAKVVYGIVGFKSHAKMMLIVRREARTLRRYVHLGTGNYNAATARQYTDMSLMTADPVIGQDVHNLFQQLTGLGKAGKLSRLVQTPFSYHELLLKMIGVEAKNAKKGQRGRIVAKMNSLTEPQIIRALYRASQAGVQVRLIVRGICCLRPGLEGISENIQVRSIVGRFLEHHRICYFYAGGKEVTLCSSADWMPRNLFRRTEVSFPIEGPKNRARVIEEGLSIYLADNSQAWIMRADGSYERVSPGKDEARAAQRVLLAKLTS